ncbi:MAG TPA: hypothetical protein IAA60_02755 [Candidatus Ornithomonoglobus intestinigallinarum]|uniref:Uncharacterized protein n=1 Tax=Candidatus Ornithomonoglobus intestinigallinarum TaxID=2840894 RepID=A0A9D1H232_9FIRM|nr:hypothetical protein [Candidatus Ornithomonoglobus intestinigallinarum]
MKGKNYLKVTGIIMTIIGIAGVIIYGLLDLILGSAVIFDKQTEGTAVMLIGVLYLAWSVLYLVSGIYGVKNCENAEKAKTCHILGTLSMIVIVFVTMLQSVGMDASGIAKQAVSTFITALIPSFYIYGAMLNAKQ